MGDQYSLEWSDLKDNTVCSDDTVSGERLATAGKKRKLG